jgi:hypothetical protein
MKINLTIEGTSKQLRAFLEGGLYKADLIHSDAQIKERAGETLENAIRFGHTLVKLDGELEVREISGCLVKGNPCELDDIESALADRH